MTVRNINVKNELRDLGLYILVSLIQTYFVCPRCNTTQSYLWVTFFTFLIWVLLWKGNSMLTHYISLKIPWVEFPIKRFLVGLVTTIGYTLLTIFGLMTLFERFLDFNFGSGYVWTVYFSVAVTIVISLVLHARAFLLSWRVARIDAERHQKESIAARYESLKNQVNPHFLFNSLNALTSLVYEDQDKAVKFIKQLSDVYRYVLDSRDKEVVPLSEELDFLTSYLYLQKIRFGDKLKIEINLATDRKLVAPLALQMLIENAIKHNVISEEEPLTINLYDEAQFIIVENNIQKKSTFGNATPGIGLDNITKRYEFLSPFKVEVITDDRTFKVKLPALHASNI